MTQPTNPTIDTLERENARLRSAQADNLAEIERLKAGLATGSRSYLIHFEDPAMPPEMFTDVGAAKNRLTQLRNNWDCHLFAELIGDRDRPAVKHEYCLCGGRGCNSCEPQGRG
jgi:hypothetical protein